MGTRSEIPSPRRARQLHGRERELDLIAGIVRRLAPGRPQQITIVGAMGIGKTRLLREAALVTKTTRAGLVSFEDDAHVEGQALRITTATTPCGPEIEENVVELGVLGCPDRAGAMTSGAPSATSIRRSPAVRMLADAARMDLEALNDDGIGALGRIAARSDGHPVVIEQLAGWLYVMSPVDLASVLEEDTSLRLVPVAFEKRLRRALAALDAEAREVLAAVAITTGAFDLAAARATVRARQRSSLPRALAALVLHGWLVRHDEGATSGTSPRWRVITPFAELAQGRRRGLEGARARLTKHYAHRADAWILSRAVADRSKVARLIDARAEVVASWEDAHARRDADELPLAAALASIATSGDPNVARHAERIRASIKSISGSHRTPRTSYRRRARLEIACGDALWFSGRPKEADACYAAAALEAQSSKERSDVAVASLAWIRRATLGPELGDLDEAHRHLDHATTLAHACTDTEPLVLVLATAIRGFLRRAANDVRGALEAFDAQSDLAERAGDVFYVASAEASAADCHLSLGENEVGRVRYERALREMKRVDAAWARTLEGYMGLAAWEVGDHAEAISRCRRAVTTGLIGPRFRVIFMAAHAGALAELGETSRAATHALERASRAFADDSRAAGATGERAIRAASLLVMHARSRGDGASLRAVESRIRDHLAKHGPSAISEDERAFVRALERVLRSPRAGARPRAPSSPPSTAWSLEGRPRLARVLAALRACARESDVVTSMALFRAAWPSETSIDPKAADARVRKAVSLLREIGLRGAIVTVDGGYKLRE